MGTLNFRNPLNFGSSSAIIAEGLEDWNEIKAVRAIARDPVTAEERQQKRRIRAAKQWAAAYGIAYWPAFAYGDKSPSRDAMVAAEAALSPKHGLYGEIRQDGLRSTGGFDSYGHHGLSGHDVQRLWFLAGCKDTAKFQFLIKNWAKDMPDFKKGDSISFCVNYQRGWRWFNANTKGIKAVAGIRFMPWLSRKAIAALGRLSPTLRWAAVSSLPEWEDAVVLRIRDLDWDAVKRAQILQCTGSAKVRLALKTPRAIIKEITGELAPVGWYIEPPLANAAIAALVPHYAMDRELWDMGIGPISLQDAKDLVLGKKTIGMCVAGGQFTDKLATVFLKEHNCPGYTDPMGWYAQRLGVPVHRSVKVMDWMSYLVKKGWWGEMEKTRTQIIGGEERQFRAIDLLDEIQEEDILTGKEGVAVVLRRASERNGEAFFQANKEDYRTLRHGLPTWVKKAPKWIKVLNTRSALALEGRDLKHCVGGYVDAVERGRSIILSISSRHGRSTVECNDNMVVMQHRGESNGAPPSRHDQLLRAFFNKMR